MLPIDSHSVLLALRVLLCVCVVWLAADVLYRNHKYGHSVLAKARSKQGIYQEYGVRAAAPLGSTSQLDGYVRADYAGPHFDLNSQYWTNPSTGDEITFIPRGLPAGSTVEVTAATKQPAYGYTGDYVGSVRTSYRANYINATAKALSDGQKHTLDASLVLASPYGADGVSIGGTVLVKADNNGAQLANAEAGVHYKAADYSAALTTSNNLNSLTASWCQLIAPATTVAASFDTPISSTAIARTLHLGTSHQVDRDTVVQAKVAVPSAAVSVYVEKRVGSAASVGSGLWSALPRGVLGFALQTSSKQTGGLGLASIDNYGVKYELGEF